MKKILAVPLVCVGLSMSSVTLAAICGPSNHWVDECPGGTDGAPSTAVITFKRGPCNGNGASEKKIFFGPASIKRSNSMDAIIGHPKLGDINIPPDGHYDVIETEMFFMNLTAWRSPGWTLRAGDGVGDIQQTLTSAEKHLYSPGAIVELVNDSTLAKAFFEIFFEINTPFGTFHNKVPHHMEAIIDRVPPLGKWHFPIAGAPAMTPLYDGNDNEVACLENSKHRLNVDQPSHLTKIYCVHDDTLNDSQFCYGAPTPLVNPLGPLYENCDIESLDIMHSTGDLYAAAGDNTPRKSHLYYVSKSDGDIVDLGNIGGPGFLREIDALSFHPLTDDLWGWAQGEGLFKITTVLIPPASPSFPPSPFIAEPLFPEAIPIQPEVNINNPVCKKPTSKVPTIPAELVLNREGEIEDITWNQKGDVLYGVENLHTDSADSHGKEEDEWPYTPLHPNIDYDEGIKLWAYNYNIDEYQVVCPNLAQTIKDQLGNEAEIEGLESLPNNFLPSVLPTEDLLVASFHGPNIIHYAGIITSPTGSESCSIWIGSDETAFNDIEGMAASFQ